jgi:uncharacterized protein YndB with AHSA1/START domain
MAKPPRIRQTFLYAATRKRVFATLTEPKELARWFLKDASVHLEEGGEFRFTWRGGYTMKGRVRRVRPPSRLELVWTDRFDGGRTYKTVARFDLKVKGAMTQLQLTHDGFKSGRKWVALFGAIEAGWAYYLTNLRSVLEHGTDLRNDGDAIA